MAKKPAPLTSDLLVRKGEATPSSISPDDRATQGSGMSSDTLAENAPQAPSSDMSAPVLDPRPQTPEPEIILAADAPRDETSNSKRRLVGVLALVAVTTAAGVAFSLMQSDDQDPSIAPTFTASDTGSDTGLPQQADATPVPALQTPVVAPLAAPPGPRSEGTPTPPDSPALRLNTTSETAPSNIAPTTDVSAPEVSVTEDASVIAEPVPAAPPRPAATITPTAPAVDVAAAVVEQIPPATTVSVAQPRQYLVQLLSVRSEVDARAAWNQIKARHAEIIGNATLDLETADLGARGTYIRVRFGAYDERSAANAACKALKAKGQDCLVKRVE